MSINIPQKVIQQTTKCRHDFSCLATGQCGDIELCKVDYANGDNILFLVSKESLDCPYRVMFAGRQVCRCPVRFAIHQKSR